MAGRAGRLIVVASVAVAGIVAGAAAVTASGMPVVAAPTLVEMLAGRYSKRSRNGLVDGTRYWSEDIVEIVPVDAGHAYIRFDLQFFNGHTCNLSGVAAAEGDTLVFHDPETASDTPPCRLTIRRQGDALTWSDGALTCSTYCGARGSFKAGALPWRSHRPIRYLKRLRASAEYRDALAAWQR